MRSFSVKNAAANKYLTDVWEYDSILVLPYGWMSHFYVLLLGNEKKIIPIS